MQPDHLRIVVGNFESEMVDIKKGSSRGILGLNQDVCAKAVCHVIPREQSVTRMDRLTTKQLAGGFFFGIYPHNEHRVVWATLSASDYLAITTVVQELRSLGRSRFAAMRTSSRGRSPRMIGQ